MGMIRLAEPYTIGELALLQSLLEGSGIEYVICHANINSLYPGVPGLNSHIMVEESDYIRAEQILHRLRVDMREVWGEAQA
ncbi:putative signal transducing protein [Petrachloros mirabilis]